VKIHCIYRSTASENSAPRPAFYSKEVALRSFVGALTSCDDATFGDILFLNDGPGMPSNRLKMMERVGEVLELNGLGNSGSYRYALTAVATRSWPDADVVYFSEDDYLYRPTALRELTAVARSVKAAAYFTLYDYPGYRPAVPGAAETPDRTAQARYLSRHQQKRWRVNSIEWRAVRSTTMSFGARVGDLRRDLWIHYLGTGSAAPNDALIWDATHSFTGQAALPALFQYANRRARIRGNAKRGAFAIRDYLAARDQVGLLIAPSSGLATHMHLPYVTPTIDWAGHAAALAVHT